MPRKDSILRRKSESFADRIVKLQRFIVTQGENVMSKQIYRSGTSIGANIREAIYGQTTADFFAKMCIALKEASETSYWLELLHESGYLDDKSFDSINSDCIELLKLLTSITKKCKE